MCNKIKLIVQNKIYYYFFFYHNKLNILVIRLTKNLRIVVLVRSLLQYFIEKNRFISLKGAT